MRAITRSCSRGGAAPDDHPQVGLSPGPKPHMELGARVRIVAVPGGEQDPAELAHRMADKAHIAQELTAAGGGLQVVRWTGAPARMA
jgi:hypothetical protein